MFTIKFYSDDGFRQVILSADSFTILRGPHLDSSSPGYGEAEITLHRGGVGGDRRIDIKPNFKEMAADTIYIPRFQKAIIENAAGRTTEIIVLQNGPITRE